MLPTTWLKVRLYRSFQIKTLFSQNSLITFEFSFANENFNANLILSPLHVIFTSSPFSFFCKFLGASLYLRCTKIFTIMGLSCFMFAYLSNLCVLMLWICSSFFCYCLTVGHFTPFFFCISFSFPFLFSLFVKSLWDGC